MMTHQTPYRFTRPWGYFDAVCVDAERNEVEIIAQAHTSPTYQLPDMRGWKLRLDNNILADAEQIEQN